MNSKKSFDQGLSPYLSKIATQMIMPSMAGNGLVPSPNSTPAQVCVRRIRKVFTVKSTDPEYSDGFTVAMFPDLYSPGYISAQSVTNIPISGGGAVSVNSRFRWTNSGPLMSSGVASVRAGSEHVVTNLSLIPDSLGVNRRGYNLIPLAATSFTLTYTNPKDSPVTIHTMYKTLGGAWTILSTDTVGALGFSTVKANTIANTDAIAVSPVTDVPNGGEIQHLMSFTQAIISSPAAASLTGAFEPFIIDNDVKTGRVISMSLLVTNTSPEIANGGTVSSGRVPHGFNPVQDVALEMSVLPENRRYQGPAATGAYVSWMPSQFDEFELDNIANKRRSYLESEYIITKIEGWAPPVSSVASAMIYCDWLVEFYTPNQLFEKVLTPPRSLEFELLYHTLLVMPAATCNPDHGKLIKDLLRKGVEGAKSGMVFYDKNKAAINGTLLLLSKIMSSI